MRSRLFSRFLILCLAAFVFGMLFSSCAHVPPPRQQVSQLDTPQHHVTTGMRLLNQEKYAEAEKSFNLASELDAKFAQAHAGIGLVRAYQGNFKAADEAVGRALKLVKTDADTVFVNVAVIRINTLSRIDCTRVGVVCKRDTNDWLDRAEGAFEKVVAVEPRSAYAHFYMGLCYKTALDFTKSAFMFSKVLDFKGDYVTEADQEWGVIQKIQRAMPGSITGKQIAFVERITRADVAALFMSEMKIDVLYKKRTPKEYDTAFRAPDATKTAPRFVTPSDVEKHPLRADIEGIIQLGVRGLETYPDGTFKPALPVDRAAYAMMIEDILIRVSGDMKLATRFIGTTSPFPDLRPDLPYYNAAMVITTRGLMGIKDFTTGEFAPLDPVSGVDALLAIRMIREALRF